MYKNKFYNLDEMDKFLDRFNQNRLKKKEKIPL